MNIYFVSERLHTIPAVICLTQSKKQKQVHFWDNLSRFKTKQKVLSPPPPPPPTTPLVTEVTSV